MVHTGRLMSEDAEVTRDSLPRARFSTNRLRSDPVSRMKAIELPSGEYAGNVSPRLPADGVLTQRGSPADTGVSIRRQGSSIDRRAGTTTCMPSGDQSSPVPM